MLSNAQFERLMARLDKMEAEAEARSEAALQHYAELTGRPIEELRAARQRIMDKFDKRGLH